MWTQDDHKTVNFKTTPRTFNNNPHYVRNFRKAKWHKYRKVLDSKISDVQFHFQNEAPDKNCKKLCNLILCTAKQYIPKGKIPKYKPFWSVLLTRLKNDREMVGKKAEISKEPKDVQTWREKAAVIKREIFSSKKQAFQNVFEKSGL
jgi:hypothetical protein